ncbi:DUF5050 domain-containing protein [Paenibacillus albicereus]|uniref:DUF5050 domain-containing protein n=1 Tax=Paenibacillus albicereus TaxID=2726185 RepID=A0A6H2H337_9BACL|nr:DUF5050 domain-containing protein [Paenibacillus albicereus]QJC54045.1 DUF5050 domain-containing protein [Paenibacillus albicereus]
MKKTALAVLAAALWAGTALAPASAADSKAPASTSLKQAFDRTVILPYDFQQKVFIRGSKTDLYLDYKLVQRDSRVFVPIRLLGYLAGEVNRSGGTWETKWDAKRPNEVVLTNAALKKTIRFAVGSRSMDVNGKAVSIDVAPYKVNGTILLPLRSASDALDKEIQWLDGLILIGDDKIDPKLADTRSLIEPIKRQLADKRTRAEVESSTGLLARSGNTSYYYRAFYTASSTSEMLYRQKDGGKPVRIELAGQPVLSQAKVADGKIYFPTVVGGKPELHALDPVTGKAAKAASVSDWKPSDGWLEAVFKLEGQLFVNLHSGDNTMGSETLYRLDGGTLQKVVGGKSLMAYARAGDRLLYTDFRFMSMQPGNLKQVDLKTGKVSSIGDAAFTYGINRTLSEGGGVSYASNAKLVVKDGSAYSLGYEEADQTATSAVYRIPLAGGAQTKLTPPASDFWLEGASVYYVDRATGKLGQAGLSGGAVRILVDRPVFDVRMHGGSLYYRVLPTGTDARDGYAQAGDLYRYDLAAGRETKLSDQPALSYEVGPKGVYYVSNGYEPGLYKVGADGKSMAIVRDNVASTLLTDSGIVYTLTYKSGVFASGS